MNSIQYIKQSGVRSESELLVVAAIKNCYYISIDEDGDPVKIYGRGVIIANRDTVNATVTALESGRRKQLKHKQITGA